MKPSGLSRRTAALLAVLAALVAGSVAWTLVLRARTEPSVPVERKLMEQRPRPVAPEILRVPPREMRALVRNDALLKPDRRFVLAFEDVAALEGARPESGATATPRDRRWTIDAGSGIRAEVSDIPGFFETLDALRSAAGTRPPTGGKKLAESESRRLRALASDPFEGKPVRALREIDALWNAGVDRRELLDLASLAFVTLEIGTVDMLEMGDVVGGRALALLALAEAAGKTRFPAREALLAYALGYPGEARQFARDLPQSEPTRAFFIGADDQLKAAAEGAAALPIVRYLYAVRLAPRVDVSDVLDWLKRHGAPRADDRAVITAALGAKDAFDHELGLASTLMMAGWAEAGGKEEKPGPGFLASFERSLVARGHEKGRLFDDAVAAAQTRAVFYSGLYGVGKFYLDSLSSGPAAQQFIDYLEGAEPGPGADFQRWYRNLAVEKNGAIKADQLVDDLSQLHFLGQFAFRRIGNRINEAVYATSPARQKGAAALERVLDSRAANDYLFSLLCRNTLMHPLAFDRYYRASMERASPEGSGPDAWFAYMARDTDALKAIAADPGAEAWKRFRAIEYLDSLHALDDAAIRASVLAVLSRKPDDATATSCLWMLRKKGFLDDAEAYLRKWLAANPDEHVLRRALYAARLERVLFQGERFDEAWSVIEPYVSTGKGDAVESGAEALEGLGRHEEARAMSTGNVERYPDNGMTRSGHAELLWRQGRYDEAPKVLLDARHPLKPREWGDVVAGDFYDVFQKKAPSETRKAFDGLMRAGVNPWFLFTFADPFAARKQYDTAIELLEAVSKSKNEGIDGNLRAYRYRALRDGREGANRWFKSEVVRSASASWVGQKAFDLHLFGLLWLLPDSDAHWMLRAQAAAFEGGAAEDRMQALVTHFRDPKTRPTDALDGLFLLGLETEDHLFESATDAGRRCDVAFLLGLKAVGGKRLEEGCDWLRVSLQAGSSARPSYKNALGILQFWDVRRFGRLVGAPASARAAELPPDDE
jgi:tetratricopeptide (TPR) repeat protein